MKRSIWRWAAPAAGIILALSCTLADRSRGLLEDENARPTQPIIQTATQSPTQAPDAAESTAGPYSRDYQGRDFSFDLPRGWTVHEGPSGTGKNAGNYYALDVNILVEAKGGNYLPQVALTEREIPAGSSLRQVFDATYAGIADQINHISEAEAVVDGRKAVVFRYNRPWGEPWYTFQDVWIEAGGKIYMISCLLKLNPGSEELKPCAVILDSLRFTAP